jgi:hypothetical protein
MLSFVMTVPYFLLKQVARAETAFAIPIKYSSQSGLTFFLFFIISMIAYRLTSLQANISSKNLDKDSMV